MSFFDRFTRRFASSGVVSQPNDTQANTGFAFLGPATPTVELFNGMFQWNDDKDNYLFRQMLEVFDIAGLTPTAGDDFTLANSIRGAFSANMRAFNVSGTFTVPASTFRVEVQCFGGGGGGGGSVGAASAGNGGGGGGTVHGVFNVTPGQSIGVVIGDPGNGGVGTAGGAGGTTSFGSICQATGGAGGQFGNNGITGAQPAGGVGIGSGTLDLTGRPGGIGRAFGTDRVGGLGGACLFGGGTPAANTNSFGDVGIFPGGGGNGGAVGNNGGNGAQGLVIVRW